MIQIARSVACVCGCNKQVDRRGLRSLDKVPQLHHLVEQVLEVFVGDFALERRDEVFCFVKGVGAEGAF